MNSLTNKIIMIRPDHFGFNPQTAASNDFQSVPYDDILARNAALSEFDKMVKILRKEGIAVTVLPSRTGAITPDAVFPNNWFSLHEFKNMSKLIVYPMLTPNRRAERQVENLVSVLQSIGVKNCEVLDLSNDEEKGHILEGTGSLVLDRQNRIAYALKSPRTTKEEFDKWCTLMNYQGIFFHATNTATNNPIYHTNVAMGIGDGFSVLCLDSLTNDEERTMVTESLKKHSELIEITVSQMEKFCGNIIHLQSKNGNPKIVLSQTAFDSFTSSQKKILQKYGKLVPVQIPTIEQVGGGSARCMIAEVF